MGWELGRINVYIIFIALVWCLSRHQQAILSNYYIKRFHLTFPQPLNEKYSIIIFEKIFPIH